MARQESDREDLLSEATALADRIELAIPALFGISEVQVVIGFRKNSCASIYFGADPVYHFNSESELRRAYLDDRLIKAVMGELVAMRRVRTGGEVQLQSHVFPSKERRSFLAALAKQLSALSLSLSEGGYQILGHVSVEGYEAEYVLQRIGDWLSALKEIRIASSPHAR